MSLQQSSSIPTTTTVSNVVASAGDVVFVFVREIIASPATPSGGGLTFTAQTLTAGDSTNGSTVAETCYRAKVTGSLNAAFTFANTTFGYEIYAESNLDTGGTNASNAVVQAIGNFGGATTNLTANYSSPTTSGNREIAGLIGYQPTGTTVPSAISGDWTKDVDDWDTGSQVFIVSASSSGVESTITVTPHDPGAAFAALHIIALELKVVSSGISPAILRRRRR